MRIVHVQTLVQTTFGVIDDDDNVVPQEPVQLQITRFAPEAFAEAFATIAKARDNAVANAGRSAPAPPAASE